MIMKVPSGGNVATEEIVVRGAINMAVKEIDSISSCGLNGKSVGVTLK